MPNEICCRARNAPSVCSALFPVKLLGFLCALLAPATILVAAERPNVVIFLADDQGWGDLSVSGNRNLNTPNIDSLARDGATFERFYVCPVCSPTRAEFLTGRYAQRGGVYSTSRGGERLDLDEKTIAQYFQQAGYATGAFGKWHNGLQSPYHPNDRGFSEYYGFCSGHWGSYFDPQLERNGELVAGEGYITDDLTTKAIEFVQRSKGEPFLCYLPYCTPHSPMQVPDQWYEKFDGAEIEMRHLNKSRESLPMTRAALAMCENIDFNVGRMLSKLDELGIADETIVIYFSDNGPNSYRWNGGMKGRKGSVDEGGVRVPFFIRWPGHIDSGLKVDRIAGAIDLLPTLADLCELSMNTDHQIDGRSLKPLLLEENSTWPDRSLVSAWGKRVSIRTQKYRLDNEGRLFDMINDPGQSHDISTGSQGIARQLKSEVEKWKQEVGFSDTNTDRPFSVGYSKSTRLPARDGMPHGKVKRSCHHPNCSFFENWVSDEASISWDIEVAEKGDYQALLDYTCRPDDVGAVLKLAAGSSAVIGQIAEAFDPPLRGAEHDRVKRQESYVKDFERVNLGTLNLPSGQAKLVLSAIKIPGTEAVDVRRVTLVKQD
ncbi:arylsulfatase [Stratiformator vulcanicus]|uniref:Arylsulfatase n=1 Tax=Stratiformator vulcanicus TaxID=2527980 RepID=A0A517QZ70_9PLAN|nr:arylsulfatase [Stratiformator vulcanicus]QDT36946.1 Arylsulfatase [Stratiformator vulcanicus]